MTKTKENINTICLPVEEKQQIENVDEDGVVLTIAGWGYTEYSERMNDVLMKAKLSFLPQEMCVAHYTEQKRKYPNLSNINIHETQMCASSSEKVDTCRGDSGTGLIGLAETASNKSRMFQHGIVSIGVQCSIKIPFPGIYTRVSKYITWILDNMEKN